MAIAVCEPGVEFKKIGKTIHDHADKYRYGVVRQFVGHGVGRVFHADPVILHFRNNEGGRMVLGQTFTIGDLHDSKSDILRSSTLLCGPCHVEVLSFT
ncbi:methionine aminopeptidase 1D, chloroplastic/mitochondrial-like isoform X3 [Macadamia integrifolia]|uniref:methionine aminopeptidase 1D, chloroplastic/mitochondrial-like isoform X3 n=1 Tax=Macadamia integrifolia TaxID=60698 RepID=UPI001C4EF26A|nr:methionine aminopeptidase 1D, chloroplastic/mitochondrial-like isoform X3 [Macadamia integrifolia]